MGRHPMFWVVVCCGLVGALLWAGPVGAQPFPGGLPACQAKLNTCNANLGTCIADLGTCSTDLVQAQTNLDTCTADLGTCNTDLGTCSADLTQAQADLAACLAANTVFPGDGVTGPALSYQDNGDGTITDLNTGLMWEKKVAGGGTCTGALHAVGASCTWSEATGTWVAAINAEGGTGYAGHNDWRVPNIKELQSIVDYGTFAPAIDASFPGPTAAASNYWSSTTFAADPTNAWNVFFFHGNVIFATKGNALRVRAVRGGP